MIVKRTYKKYCEKIETEDVWEVIKFIHRGLTSRGGDVEGVKYIIEVDNTRSSNT